MYKPLSQVLGALAVLMSLLLVAYELKRNNDISVVQSQYELLSLQNDMRAMLADPNVLRVVMTRDLETLSEEEQLLFKSSVMGWFDLFELVLFAAEQGVMSDEQFEAWKKGMCTVPEHWLTDFSTTINEGNFMEPLVKAVEDCLDPSDRSPKE
jgi:hypothetical protein